MVIRQQIYTVDDVWEIAHDPQNENNHYDLINGELWEIPPPGGVHGRLASKISRYLGIYADEYDLGEVTVETGYHPKDDRKTLLSPDVAFLSKANVPDPFPEKYIPVMPDLAVEIVSPSDVLKQVRRKAMTYLQHGTKIVWIVLPSEQGVDVCRSVTGSRLDIEFVEQDGVLSGEDVLPKFELNVSILFPPSN